MELYYLVEIGHNRNTRKMGIPESTVKADDERELINGRTTGLMGAAKFPPIL